MPRASSKRVLSAIDALTTTPPAELTSTQSLARIITNAGSNLYNVRLPSHGSGGGRELLVELRTIFRSKVWLRRGGHVLVDTAAFAGRENKLGGEIVNVVRDEREWRKMGYWPKEFTKEVQGDGGDDESEEESVMGKLPPTSDNED